MNNKTVVTNLKNSDDQLVGIHVKTHEDEFTVPVVDVRRSEDQRRKAKRIMKESNRAKGSKFIRPSYSWYGYSYN